LQRNITVNALGRDQGHCLRQHSLPTLEAGAVAAIVPESFDILRIAAGRAGLELFTHLRPRLERNPRAKVLLEADPTVATGLLRSLEAAGYTCSRILDNGQIERVIQTADVVPNVLLVERRGA